MYGGIGRAARDWECFDMLVEVLVRLEEVETLLETRDAAGSDRAAVERLDALLAGHIARLEAKHIEQIRECASVRRGLLVL